MKIANLLAYLYLLSVLLWNPQFLFYFIYIIVCYLILFYFLLKLYSRDTRRRFVRRRFIRQNSSDVVPIINYHK